jgi:hypothetical protein
MKTKISMLCICSLIFLSGCIKDTLDRKPLNFINDADVWSSTPIIDLYMIALYDAVPNSFGSQNYESVFTDESAAVLFGGTILQRNYGSYDRFQNNGMYTWIRRANYFLERIKTAGIPDDLKKRYTAECRFIRAYYYLDLVKKYGGMPIIDQVQTFTGGNLAELKVPRNKEDDVYALITSELDAAILDLPPSWDDANANRATKTVAQALKSRATLYAGSIAKYGTVGLNGLIGIPASRADFYFQESIKAATAVMESNKYSLYTKSYNPITKVGDPVKNYTDIFLDENNSEVVYQRAYSKPDKVHNWDFENTPVSYVGSTGSSICPILELVEAYEYVDGTAGVLDVAGREFDSPDQLFANKDPRFSASIFRSGSPYIGRPLQIYSGIYDTDGKLFNLWNAPFPKDPAKLQTGLDGPSPLTRYTKTGFYVRKYINQTEIVNTNTSAQNYLDIRYAEVLLNFAEAALETNTNLAKALEAINLVRGRAGIRLLTAGELTINRLRNERRVELAFEDKRFWDMRRWRVAAEIFKNSSMHGLYPYLRYTGSGYKYQFQKISGFPLDEGLTRTFEEKDYYSNLAGYISSNTNIVNNPGW